ncbi:MAG TPA: protease pro-enzyme activation domain-containing protein [Candidatus Sulfotelmatobacter sp.]|jgi:subtilase family serine protease|nr:protease pro-enzyme activation domain-containing protein [Candidatus Sulfotelmatobacter sp.]
MKISGIKNQQALCVIAAAAALCALALVPLASAQTPKRLVTQAVDESQRVALRGNVHPWARAEFDQGTIADAQPVNRIYLLLNRGAEQQIALDKIMQEQVDASSPNFHKWLTPEQYGAQFGPSDEDVQAVKNWLGAQGFTGVKISAGKTIVEFNGTVGSVRKAFQTDLHKYMVRGEEHFANVSDPKIPAALAPVVMGVVSLHNFRKQSHIKRFGKFRRDLTTGEIRPLFTFTDVNGTFFGMGPADFAKIYNIPSGADGTGQSIAIVGRSNINIQDVIDFRNMFGLTPANNVTVILNGADPGLVSGDEGEADLDVEWSGAVAPKATIMLVVSESEQTDAVDGVDASAKYIVDNNIAPVMSESFGSCEAANGTAGNAFLNSLWQQAAAEGITVSVSSGDNGSAGCDDPNSVTSASKGIAVSGTASTPFNVAVGGTDFDNSTGTFWSTTNTTTTTPVPASALGYIPEIPWNDSCAATGLTGCNSATASTNLDIVAGSGGPSSIYTKTQAPFQTGFGDATARDIPDVSLFAADGLNKSFYIICESDQDIPGDTGCNLSKFVTTSPFHDFQTVGGTSASAPAFAGIMALVNQTTGQRQGNANFVLYSLAQSETFSSCNSSSFTAPGTQPAACVFMDITKSNNAVACVGGTPGCSKTTSGGNGVLASSGVAAFAAGTGYDKATGLGSINVAALLNKWAAPGTTATSTTLSPASITTTVGTPQTLSGTVTAGSGTPTGIVVIENSSTGAQIDSIALTGTSYSIPTTFLPGGIYSIKAHYGGDGKFGPSDSPLVAVNSTKQGSKVIVSFVNAAGALVTSVQTVAYGSPYILRVDVANNAGTPCETISTGAVNFICPTGTVTLLDNAAALNDFPNAQTPNATNVAHLNNRGFIEDQPIQLNTGTHTITATYPGDASYNAGTSNTLSVTITQATTTTSVVGSPSTITSGGTVALTATVSSQSNADKPHAPSGTIQFMNGSTNIGAPVTCTQVGSTSSAGASCTATFSTTLSALAPPISFDNRWRRTPYELLAALFAMLAVIFFIATRRLRGPRRAYAYASVVAFLIASAALAGCSGPSSSGGGGGGGGKTITAKYSGDTNYTASQGSGTVTVH